MHRQTGKTRVVPEIINDLMRESRKHSADQRLEDAIYPDVLKAELQARNRRFLPEQVVKVALRSAVVAVKRDGFCVLPNGHKVLVPQVHDALANAKGFHSFAGIPLQEIRHR